MIVTKEAKEKIKSLIRDTDDCINYPILNKDGYGCIQQVLNGRKLHMLTHRIVYQLYYNIDLNKDNIICHKCDNPACINPKHLFLGTHLDNIKDKVAKNRQAKGKNNGRYIDGRASDNKIKKIHTHGRKLTWEQVTEIKRLKSEGIKLIDISDITKISYQTIRDISCGRIYKKSI